MSYFKNKTYFISGASRGIGKAIALKLAAEGANIIIAAKSVEENPKLGGTIYTAAEEIEKAGGQALPVECDIRNEGMVENAVIRGAEKFGRFDGVINNASAISLTNTPKTQMKRYDLMMDINVRGTFMVVKRSLPFLRRSENPHIITMSPPINFKNPKWFKEHIAYTMSKFNMTMLTIGWADEFREYGIAANALWPATTIATKAVENILGGQHLMDCSRKTDIIADCAYYMLQQDAKTYTGQQLLDEDVMKQAGKTVLSEYAVKPGNQLRKDIFID